jgi:biofilm PGA synthesis N-glycosyltransferase PgaC
MRHTTPDPPSEGASGLVTEAAPRPRVRAAPASLPAQPSSSSASRRGHRSLAIAHPPARPVTARPAGGALLRPPLRASDPSPSAGKTGRRVYIPLRVRAMSTMVMGALWFCFSLWLSRPWIMTLGHEITLPLAIVVIAGIALIPGYLNIQLITAILIDRPRTLRFRRPFPAITLMIAAYNEEAAIAETLDYVLATEYPGEFQVVVADDGSTDATRKIVAGYQARHGSIRLVAAEHAGKAETLNHALDTVNTPLVATIDADTLLMPYSLRRAVARMLTSPPDTVAVAGAVLVRNSRQNLLTRAQEWDYFLGIASVKRAQGLLQGTLVAQGAFSVYDTTALKLIGGWPNRIGEDIVLTWKLLLQGGRSVFEPTAVAFTEVPAQWGAFARQRRRWARGMIEGLRDHGFGLLRNAHLYSHSVASNFLFPFLDACFTLAFVPGVVLAATGNFDIVGPMTLMVMPLNAVLGGVMFWHQRQVFSRVKLTIRKNKRGLFFYFFCYQFMMSPISLGGYLLEAFGARRRW